MKKLKFKFNIYSDIAIGSEILWTELVTICIMLKNSLNLSSTVQYKQSKTYETQVQGMNFFSNLCSNIFITVIHRFLDCLFQKNTVKNQLVARWSVRFENLFRTIMKRYNFSLDEIELIDSLEYRTCQHPS